MRFGKINELLIAPTGLINYVKCSVCTYVPLQYCTSIYDEGGGRLHAGRGRKEEQRQSPQQRRSGVGVNDEALHYAMIGGRPKEKQQGIE